MAKFVESKLARLIQKYFPKYYYKKIIFSGHEMYWPRWGHTKAEIESAEKRANELYNSLNWEEDEKEI